MMCVHRRFSCSPKSLQGGGHTSTTIWPAASVWAFKNQSQFSDTYSSEALILAWQSPTCWFLRALAFPSYLCFGRAGDWTQGLAHARQKLSMSLISNPVSFIQTPALLTGRQSQAFLTVFRTYFLIPSICSRAKWVGWEKTSVLQRKLYRTALKWIYANLRIFLQRVLK
jgi:hypothetical protein